MAKIAVTCVLVVVFSVGWANPIASVDERQRPASRQDSLSIAGQNLWIGMQKDEAEKALASCCKPLAPTDGAFVVSKDGKQFFGAVWFRGGRVSALRSDEYASTESSASAFALRLFRLASEVGGKGDSVEVTTNTVEATDATLRTLVLKFGDGRSLEIWHSQHDGGHAQAELKISR